MNGLFGEEFQMSSLPHYQKTHSENHKSVRAIWTVRDRPSRIQFLSVIFIIKQCDIFSHFRTIDSTFLGQMYVLGDERFWYFSNL